MHARPSLSIADASEFFGVHPDTIRRWLRAGELTYTRLGGRIRFSQADFDSYLERRAQPLSGQA
jgi:excisionase family DNA binding protein